METRMEPRLEPTLETNAPAAEPVAAMPVKPEGRVSLFGRYRSLTSRKEEVRAPEPRSRTRATARFHPRSSSLTARSAWAIAESVYAAPPASELAMAIRPKGALPMTLGRRFSGPSGSKSGLYSGA